jgi:TolB-like protein/Flp pilus assembly protein TadD
VGQSERAAGSVPAALELAIAGRSVIGRHVSHFYVIRSLGTGGMGVVYEAQDTHLPRSVAIKFLTPGLSRDVEAVRRFKREARLASSLNHPNICTVLDVDEFAGQSFIAMELLHGQSLKERLGRGLMPLSEILDVGIQIASALAVAHERGIMHRDITPGNIFVTDSGLVKLLDFGLARHFARSGEDHPATDTLTRTGAGPEFVPGTAPYMAPELFADDCTPDHRCDLYSLGAVLYEMATGAKPFVARSRQDLATLVREQPHIPLRRLAPQQPKQLEEITDGLLAKRPADRFQSGLEVRRELERLKADAAVSRPIGARPRATSCGIAIMPFEVVGADPGPLADLGDGVAEDLSGRLSQVRDLRVAPRTSIVRVRGLSATEIGLRLNTPWVLTGTVEQAGERVLVRASLLDAKDGRAAEPALELTASPDDLFQAQDQIASEIAERVGALLTREPERGSTHDAEALQAFKRGQHHWRSRFGGGWQPAIEHFQQAIERDRRFALAHVALAAAYEFLGFFCMMKPKLAYSVARRSIERALELQDGLAAAHTQLALIELGGEWDWDASEAAFRRALQLDPANPTAHVCYAWLLMLLGREAAALEEARIGHELAPGSRFATMGRAQTVYLARRYDEAIGLCDECLRLDPDYVAATLIRGQCYELRGQMPEAIADLERAARLANRAPYFLGVLGHCYGLGGLREQANALLGELDRLSRETYVPPQCYVFIHAGLGDRTQALAFQARAYEDGASPFNYLAPYIRDLYALDPHHKRRLEQMRLAI